MSDLLLAQKITYGLTPDLIEKVKKIGFSAFLDEQLAPKEEEDGVYLQKIQTTQYTVEISKKKESRSFSYLKQPAAALFDKLNQEKVSYETKNLPAFEVYADAWLRAIYSNWQLKEILVDFWHNHFAVNVQADVRISISLPLYDTTIRNYCFGNFRTLLEKVAQSPAMLYYLDNYNSKASPANENYARELFELHTLGAENYLNHLYNRWKEVPNALQEKPIGYIDEDVYEAARAFTGWTVNDGRDNEKGGKFANNGAFFYYEGWHDSYQKRVLGVEFPPNQPPLADGLKVLDLLANHPATAKFICTKLCQRLVTDQPPISLISKAMEVWTKNINSPEQIKLVLKTILTSDEMKQAVGQKSKRPFELLVSAIRALQAPFTPNQYLLYLFASTGQHLFTNPFPKGNPDTAQYWHNPNFLLARWNALITLISEDWHKLLDFDVVKQTPNHLLTARQITEFWLNRFLPLGNNEKIKEKCANFLAQGGDIDDEVTYYNDDERKHRLVNMVALIAMSPAFQMR
jgi:uncharacterized protein (DUF1800 family)